MAQPGHYAQSADAAATVVGDRIVLYHRVTRTAVVLNPPGGVLWRELATSRTVSDLAAGLHRQFPSVPADDAERDVHAFLDDLARHALVSHQP